MQWFLFLIIGAVAGFIGGLLGVGGGVVIVPGLAILAGVDMHRAVGTSSAVIVFTALSAAYKHHYNGNVMWPTVVMVAMGSIACAFLGAALAEHVPQNLLKRIFALFLVIVAIRMFISSYQSTPTKEPLETRVEETVS